MNTARASALLFLTCAVNTASRRVTAWAFGRSASNPQTGNHQQRPSALAASYSQLPLSFEANQGQTDPRVRFLSLGQGYSLLPGVDLRHSR